MGSNDEITLRVKLQNANLAETVSEIKESLQEAVETVRVSTPYGSFNVPIARSVPEPVVESVPEPVVESVPEPREGRRVSEVFGELNILRENANNIFRDASTGFHNFCELVNDDASNFDEISEKAQNLIEHLQELKMTLAEIARSAEEVDPRNTFRSRESFGGIDDYQNNLIDTYTGWTTPRTTESAHDDEESNVTQGAVEGAVSSILHSVLSNSGVGSIGGGTVGSVLSILKAVPPQLAVIGTAAVAGAILLKKSLEHLIVLEKAQIELRNAYRSGRGRQTTASIQESNAAIKEAIGKWALNSDDLMKGEADLRMKYTMIGESTKNELREVIGDASAFLGTNAQGAYNKLGQVLDSTSVSFEQLRDLGLSFDRNEIETINRYKSTGTAYGQEKANEIIMARAKETYKGAYDDSMNTLTGDFQKSSAMWTQIFQDIGETLKPILRILMAVWNVLSYVLTWVTWALKGLMDLIVELIRLVSVGFIDLNNDNKKEERGKSRGDRAGMLDPRVSFQSSFEGLSSMYQRIQTSLLNSYSPEHEQYRMLGQIYEVVKDISGTTKKNEENTGRNAVETSRVARSVDNLNPGLT